MTDLAEVGDLIDLRELPPTATTPDGPPPPALRDAVIVVPGIGSRTTMDPALIAEVLAHEMDRAATSSTARFLVRPRSSASADAVDVVRTITRVDGDTQVPVVDLYAVDPARIQPTTPASSNPAARVLALGLTVVAGMAILGGAILRSRRAKARSQLLQLLLCLVVLGVLGAYFLLAVAALAQLVIGAWGGGQDGITWPQSVVVVSAVAATVFPTARTTLMAAAEQYLRAVRYLWVAGPRNVARGEVLAVVERVAERDDVDRIHLVGFSFGSLVALDTVFPSSGPAAARLERIATLVTIGCPFDLVRMLQPRYPEGRTARGRGPRWVNVYEPIDVLGSNFRDDEAVGEPATRGVCLAGIDAEVAPGENIPWNVGQRLTAVNVLLLASLTVHQEYWGSNPRADTAFGDVVEAVFRSTPVLA